MYIYDCASENQSYLFYHMLMFNCSFLSRLVPESNTIWYLGRTRTCLKELIVLLVLLVLIIRRLKNYQLNKSLSTLSFLATVLTNKLVEKS